MSEQKKISIKLIDENTAFVVGVILVIILCAGDPDLLDAIIKRVGSYPDRPKTEQVEKPTEPPTGGQEGE